MLPVASLLILVPLIFAAVTFFTKTKEQAAGLGFLGSLVTLGLTLYAYLNFDSSTAAMQFFESTKWIPSLGANYTVGIDGISMPLILLNAIVIPFLILYSWKEDREAPNRFYGLILTMQAAVIGVFVSLDFLVFYIFWELTLIPLFFMVNIWGGEKRAHASYKFFIYTHVASLVMLLGIFGLFYASWQQTGVPTFDIRQLVAQFQFIGSGLVRDAIFLSIIFGFLAKLPTFPFHSWLPDAYTEAPTAGSVLFILLKIGGYGLFRISLPMLPNTGSPHLMIMMLGLLGSFSILYGALVALRQKDLKRMIAYSSLSHMGYVITGFSRPCCPVGFRRYVPAVFPRAYNEHPVHVRWSHPDKHWNKDHQQPWWACKEDAEADCDYDARVYGIPWPARIDRFYCRVPGADLQLREPAWLCLACPAGNSDYRRLPPLGNAESNVRSI